MLPDLSDGSSFLPNLPEYNLDSEDTNNPENNTNSNLKENFDSDLGGDHGYNPDNSGLRNMQKSGFEPLPRYPVNTTPGKIIAEPLTFPNNVNKENRKFLEPRTFEISDSSKNFKEERFSSTKNLQPIYVKLDNFKLGLDSFEDIRSKINEIENLLLKIKEMREKEEKELIEWERESQVIKARIDKINNDIFKNVE